jgi:hypothetical protein
LRRRQKRINESHATQEEVNPNHLQSGNNLGIIMFTFATRPGFSSKRLLIEFSKGVGSEEMISALKKALNSIGAKTEKINVVWRNDEILYDIFCELETFQISTDNYESFFFYIV